MSFAPPKMLSTKNQDRLLGLFVVVAVVSCILIFTQTINFGKQPPFIIQTMLSSAFGISKGAPVRMRGVVIGKVDSIDLDLANGVKVTLQLEQQYRQFYRQNSQLKVDTTLDLDNVLIGSGLIFIPGNGELLVNNAVIATQEPKSIEEIFEEWDLEQISTQLRSIINNVEQLTTRIAQHDQAIEQTMRNTAQVSENLVSITNQLPDLLAEISTTSTTLTKLAQENSQQLQHTLSAGQPVIDTAQSVLNDTQVLIQTATQFTEALHQVALDVPQTQQYVNQALIDVNKLTLQLQNHWLLGKQSTPDEHQLNTREPIITIHDDELYRSPNPTQ